MKNKSKIFTLAALTVLLIGCEPGPVHLGTSSLMGFGSNTVPVKEPDGQVKYVSAPVDKKGKLMVPPSTGAKLTTNKILAEFAQDPILRPYHIQVHTHHGVVKLIGQVPSEAIKNHAIRVARQNSGVLAANANSLIVTNK